MTNYSPSPTTSAQRGFYFHTLEEYEEKSAKTRNDYGQPVEEYELQFIDGESIDAKERRYQTALRILRAERLDTCFLARHAIGDWGELEPTDVAENKYSLIHGFRLLSSYQTDAGEKLWIITEADRSATTLLLPEEY
jgi:hypothetical protein